jgi:hypothetical protein
MLTWKKLARWTGLEPATPGVTGRYSNQLSYHRALRGGIERCPGGVKQETPGLIGGRSKGRLALRNGGRLDRSGGGVRGSGHGNPAGEGFVGTDALIVTINVIYTSEGLRGSLLGGRRSGCPRQWSGGRRELVRGRYCCMRHRGSGRRVLGEPLRGLDSRRSEKALVPRSVRRCVSKVDGLQYGSIVRVLCVGVRDLAICRLGHGDVVR